LDGGKRVPADFEEILVDGHFRNAQNFTPDRCEFLFERTPDPFVGSVIHDAGRFRVPIRRQLFQGGPVDLAVGVRKLVQRQKLARDHGAGTFSARCRRKIPGSVAAPGSLP
jgi:hypothetical protein